MRTILVLLLSFVLTSLRTRAALIADLEVATAWRIARAVRGER
jgi:hypothetical protein